MSITEAPPAEETDAERLEREHAEQAERLAANAEDPPPAQPAAEPEPEAPESESKPTQYVVVAMIHMPLGEDLRNEQLEIALDLHKASVDVPFVIGGHKTPELFEAKSGPKQAKTAALEAHPELAACVREPGLSLATWPFRSYEFKQVSFTPQPDKLEV